MCASEKKAENTGTQLLTEPTVDLLAVKLAVHVCVRAKKKRLDCQEQQIDRVSKSVAMTVSSWSRTLLRLLMYSVKFVLPIIYT